MATVPLIAVDLYSGDRVEDFAAAKAAGVELILHKASEGSTYRDPVYQERRKAARDAGLLWAAYHFGKGTPVQAQIDNFLGAVLPDDAPTLRLVLDWENTAMSVGAAKTFLAAIDAKTGKQTVLYSYASFLNEKLGVGVDKELGRHPLWLAAYRNTPLPPPPQASWSNVLLWQYTDGASGASPKRIPGISGNDLGQVDCNTAPGLSAEAFKAAWLGSTDAPEHPRDWRWAQAQLNTLGADPRLVVDGDPGPATLAAIVALLEEHLA